MLDSAVHEQDPDRALIRAAIIIPGGSDRQIREPAVVEIANAGDRGAEVIISIQVTVKSPRAVGHFLPSINSTTRFHHQDPDRARVVGAVVIIRGAYRQIRDPVAVQVPGAGNRAAEAVIVIEVPVKAAGALRYLLLLPDPAPGIEKQYPQATPIHATIVIPGRPGREVKSAIAVEITDTRNRTAKQVISIEISPKTACIAGDLLFPVHPPVVVHEQDPDGALVVAIVIIKGGAHGQVPDTVSFQVAEIGDGAAELIPVAEISIKTAAVRGDLLFVTHPNPGIRIPARRITFTGIIRTLEITGACQQQTGYQ